MTIEKKVNILIAYAFATTLCIGLFALSSFGEKDKNESFDEITVKKMTVIGKNNLPRMVLSNETRQNPGRMNGKEWSKRERPSGIIFFNDNGDECGGIIYKVSEKDGKTVSGMSFTMDNYKDDQVIQILNDEYYADGKAYIERGISINQFPLGSDIDVRNGKIEALEKIADEKERNTKIRELIQAEGSKKRLFLGRTKGNGSGLFLSGPDGKPKMMIYVDDKGAPKIQTFNDKGEVKDLLEQ